MELLETLTIYHGAEPRTIELHRGDLTDLGPEEAIDLLVVSAFRGDYWPRPGTLIGALDQKGVSVEELAKEKGVDLLDTCSCWLSKQIREPAEGIQFKKILCFEPEEFTRATLFVGDIFRSLMALLPARTASTSVAMPLVSTGSMNLPATEMLEAILDEATHWLTLGLPIHTLKIVGFSPEKIDNVRKAFVRWCESHAIPEMIPARTYDYDLFISYSHKNKEHVDFMVAYLKEQRPDLSIFLDRHVLNPGMAWQQEIYEAIDNSRHVVAVYSPDYVKSKMCKNEFGIATYRELNQTERILFPIFLYSAELPSYMGAIHFEDCREGDEQRLRDACDKILQRLPPSAPSKIARAQRKGSR